MSYQVIATTPAIIQHASSGQEIRVELAKKNTESLGRFGYKNTEEIMLFTFEGRFQIDIEAGRKVSGRVTVTVECETSLNGVDDVTIRNSSVIPASCQIIELPQIEVVEDEYSPLDP